MDVEQSALELIPSILKNLPNEVHHHASHTHAR